MRSNSRQQQHQQTTFEWDMQSCHFGWWNTLCCWMEANVLQWFCCVCVFCLHEHVNNTSEARTRAQVRLFVNYFFYLLCLLHINTPICCTHIFAVFIISEKIRCNFLFAHSFVLVYSLWTQFWAFKPAIWKKIIIAARCCDSKQSKTKICIGDTETSGLSVWIEQNRQKD